VSAGINFHVGVNSDTLEALAPERSPSLDSFVHSAEQLRDFLAALGAAQSARSGMDRSIDDPPGESGSEEFRTLRARRKFRREIPR